MTTRMLEVQQSIYKQVNSNPIFTEKVNGLYDFVPESTKLPYSTFGEIQSLPLDTKTSNGERIVITIDVWSESKGRKEVVEILSEIEKSLKEEIELETAMVISQKITGRKVWEENYGLFTGQIDIEVKIMWEEI